MNPPRFFTLIGAAGLCACAVEVTDETPSPLSYNPPINEQTFRVRVDSDAAVTNIDLIVPGIGTDTMSPVGNDRYEGTLPLSACAGVAEFSVEVTTNGLFEDPTESYPPAGYFTHPVTGLPDACDEFADEVAQTFIVDRFEDFPDFIVGNGTCAGVIDTELGCSLRAAVMEANAHPGHDLIRVPVGRYVLTRESAGFHVENGDAIDDWVRDLDITETVTIEATGGTTRDVLDFLVESNDRTENLADDPSSNNVFVKIDGNGIDRIFQVTGAGTVLRLRNLAIVNGSPDGAGGGGGILNDATVVLERVALASNEVTKPSAGGIGGGGIQNNGVLIADDIAITQNTVGEAVFNPQGGGIFNTGTATIRRALIAYNSARFGNAIHNDNSGAMVVENTTIHDHLWDNDEPVTVVRNEGDMDLSYVTVSRHQISDRNLLSNGDGDMRLRNTLVLDNTADHCTGTIISLGGNVIEGPCTLSGSATAADHVDVIVNSFGALDYRGGFTPVFPFSTSTSSIALSAIDLGSAPPYPFWDQRGDGFDRRVNGDGEGASTPDAGAWEFEG